MRIPIAIIIALLACGCATNTASVPTAAPVPSEGFITARDGAKLRYRIVGSGDRTVIVPLIFWNIARFEKDAPAELRFLFYDPRGRQGSDPSTDATANLDQFFSDLETVQKFSGAEKVSLIGTSIYGALIARYAMLHPERVDRIVMVGAAAPTLAQFLGERPSQDRAKRVDAEAEKKLADRAATMPGEEYCRAWWDLHASLYVGSPTNAHLVERNCQYQNEWPTVLGPRFRSFIVALGNYDWTEDARSIAAPTLIIHGTNDMVVSMGSSRSWARAIPTSRMLQMQRAGHLPWYDVPDDIFPAVMTFLRGSWPPGVRLLSRISVERDAVVREAR